MIVDHDAAPLAHTDSAGFRQFVARSDSRRNEDHVDVERLAVAKHHPFDATVALHLLRPFVQVDLDAEIFDILDEYSGSCVINLTRHQSPAEFDHVCLQAQVMCGFRRFEAEQPAANHGGSLHVLSVGDDPPQVLDRAIDEDAAQFDPFDGRHEGKRARREHDVVVSDLVPFVGDDPLLFAVDGVRSVANVKFDAVATIPLEIREHKLFRVAMGEERGQSDAIVSRPRLFTERNDAIPFCRIELDQLLAKAMPDHSIADDDNRFHILCDHWFVSHPMVRVVGYALHSPCKRVVSSKGQNVRA